MHPLLQTSLYVTLTRAAPSSALTQEVAYQNAAMTNPTLLIRYYLITHALIINYILSYYRSD